MSLYMGHKLYLSSFAKSIIQPCKTAHILLSVSCQQLIKSNIIKGKYTAVQVCEHLYCSFNELKK